MVGELSPAVVHTSLPVSNHVGYLVKQVRICHFIGIYTENPAMLRKGVPKVSHSRKIDDEAIVIHVLQWLRVHSHIALGSAEIEGGISRPAIEHYNIIHPLHRSEVLLKALRRILCEQDSAYRNTPL